MLAKAGIAFEVIASPLPEPEHNPADVNVRAWAMALAYFKAAAVARNHPQRWVLGADTIVVVDDQILNKAETVEQARQLLMLQMGRASIVLTGLALVCSDPPAIGNDSAVCAQFSGSRRPFAIASASCSDSWYLRAGAPWSLLRHFRCTQTRVWMKNDPAAMERYLATGDWRGKAGAYGIQDVGDALVERIEGSFSNVVGLPVEVVTPLLDRLGL